MKIIAPVLLIAFNRPETTCVVFEYIRKAKPTKLYVALDGARENKPYESIVCQEVCNIVERVDWECDVHYSINDCNKGAEITVSEAIRWVFEKEEYAIILEDDIVAPLSFFCFAQEMLYRYKDDERISLITSNNFTPEAVEPSADYYFTRYGHSGGWATWRREYKNFSIDQEIKEEHLRMSFLQTITNSKKEARYYQKHFKRLRANGVGGSTWDWIDSYQHRVNSRLTITPRVNLSSNIGIQGLHARGKNSTHYREFDTEFSVIKHPEEVKCEVAYDIYHFENYINRRRKSFLVRVLRKLTRILDSQI